jgi:hypothetical protein
MENGVLRECIGLEAFIRLNPSNRWGIKNGEPEGEKLSEADEKNTSVENNVPQGYFQCDRVAKGQFFSPSEPFVSFQL